MTMKSDAIFEEKMTCGLENDMTNLANFYQSTRKSQNWDFDRILLCKIENYGASNLQRSYVSRQWKEMQNLRRSWLAVSKLTPKFDKFWPKHWNASKKFHFKVYNIWPKKAQEIYVWWHCRLMQNLKENWLELSKMTWVI